MRTLLLALLLLPNLTHASELQGLLDSYRANAGEAFSAERGATLWQSTWPGAEGTRQCADCHGADLRRSGRHAKTGKTIEPLAPSANPQRLTQRSEMEKWLLRNCKWTLGRPCSDQEKGDLLTYLSTQ